ncbi:hypothetical protein K461DRAFT_166314 [Myriangium duriaei CBS 260.36]|uniref:Uncharacterized protein n=1 Tax=Myriangium duriaei CBS 260.36 TaxID=1168546 RepID=A0A9P4MEE3_9PEZI|nr:hypothetical protein K461DRAFT_166314 [Myriangium duriaei CBS 260.36]
MSMRIEIGELRFCRKSRSFYQRKRRRSIVVSVPATSSLFGRMLVAGYRAGTPLMDGKGATERTEAVGSQVAPENSRLDAAQRRQSEVWTSCRCLRTELADRVV